MLKKSAFDVLMNKINKSKDDSNIGLNAAKSKELKKSNSNKKHINQNDCDVILLNDSAINDDVEIVQNENIYQKSTLYKNSPRKKATNTNINPLHLQHTYQYTELEKEFLVIMKNNLDFKIKLKEEIDSITLFNNSKLDLNQPLNFDFTKYDYKFNKCLCKMENDFNHISKDVTFSLNNSFESDVMEKNISINETITEETKDSSLSNNINRTFDSLNDTLNDSLSNLSPSSSYLDSSILSRSRFTKRRKRDHKNKYKHTMNDNTDASDSVSFSNERLLWTEKYQFKNEDDIVTNNSQIERLKEWLSNWKSILSKTTESYTKKPSFEDCDESDSDYSYDSDYSNADSISSNSNIVNGRKFYSNAILLSGPHGCGKTSSIYSVAKQLGFKVFEVNPSSLRCKSQIIQELEGALNSHHVSNNNNNINTPSSVNDKNQISKLETNNFKIEKFFKSASFATNPAKKQKESILKLKKNPVVQKSASSYDFRTKNAKKRKNSLRREAVLSTASNRFLNDSKLIVELSSDSNNEEEIVEGSEEDSKDSNEVNLMSNNINIHKESLILFDEIDVVFKEDVGFWAAINHFIKRSKKPIILTTSDDFLQEKINLNIEKLEYNRPRIDASVRFLKSVALSESTRLDTPTAYKILRDCKCDMRRALFQLQALISSSTRSKSSSLLIKKYRNIALNSTLNLNKFLTKYLFSKCNIHNEREFFQNLLFLDKISYEILKLLHLESSSMFNIEQPVSFRRYDLFLLKDGLTDNSSANLSFNPFSYIQSNDTRTKDDLTKLNTHFKKESLAEIYETFILLFNDKKNIDFLDWSNYGTVNEFNFSSNVSINRLAQGLLKFTSNSSLCLEYRPFLQQICKIEELKQINNGSRRRYIHYLTHLNIGLNKDDYSLLSKSSFFDNWDTKKNLDEQILDKLTPSYDDKIYSDEK